MSNETPTFEEVKHVVDTINNLYEEEYLQDERIVIPFTICVAEAVHDSFYIRVLGTLIWSNDEDHRPYIDEEHPEYEEGVDKKVSLEDHIVSELMSVNIGLNRMLDKMFGLVEPLEDSQGIILH